MTYSKSSVHYRELITLYFVLVTMPKSKKQYAYGIELKKDGKIIEICMTRREAREKFLMPFPFALKRKLYKIVVLELRKINKKV